MEDQKTLLIVDDDEGIRESLQTLFEGEGYQVLLAHDGQMALDIIANLPSPSVILLDFRMPQLDDYGVLQDLAAHPRKRDAHPIFLLTANVNQLAPEMVQLLGREGVPVLPKPFDIDRLCLQVQSAFDRIANQQT